MASKKRKREGPSSPTKEVDTSKPTAIFKPSSGRRHTLSLALPGSIITNAQSPDLQTKLAGQIARALAVFCVDEVVVFDDGTPPNSQKDHGYKGRETSYTGYSEPNYFLAHLLSYLECPPYLRRTLFSMHPDLRLAGSLPSLDMPHHLRNGQWCRYREGVTMEDQGWHPGKDKKKGLSELSKTHTLVETGLETDVYVFVEGNIPANQRVTVKFGGDHHEKEQSETIEAEAVDPNAPREEDGYYWGYQLRSADSLSAVLTESPYEEGYDLTFGTSERGEPIDELTPTSSAKGKAIPEFSHMLIVLGGVAGLEVAVKADKELQGMGVKTPEALFDFWVDLVPGQGSRTIRTEEATWLALMGLKKVVDQKGAK